MPDSRKKKAKMPNGSDKHAAPRNIVIRQLPQPREGARAPQITLLVPVPTTSGRMLIPNPKSKGE